MADVHSQKTRSFNMSRIMGKNTKPEILVRKFLHSKGFRFSLHDKNLPGKPDIVLSKHKVVLFVHGCSWHGHKNCKYFVIPKTRTQWWLNKINKNRLNDKKTQRAIQKQGWKTITVWECNLKSKRRENTLEKLLKSLNNISQWTYPIL